MQRVRGTVDAASAHPHAPSRATAHSATRRRSNRRRQWRTKRLFATVFVYRKEAHPQELREARERPAGAVPARDAARVVPRVPAGGHAGGSAQERRPAGRVHVDIPDLEPFGQRPARVRQLLAAAAGVRRHRVPAARPHVLLGAARQGAPDPDGQGSAEGDGQGSEGAGGLHGRDPAHDRQRLVHHQRHRARHRLAAAPLARRVLRARPRQDAHLRQAPVLGARDSVPRLVARLRVRPEGFPVLPRRPPPQDAGDDAAEGDRPHQRGHPASSSSCSTRSTCRRRARSSSSCRSGCAAKWRASTSLGKDGKVIVAARQADHRAARARARRGRREADRRADRLHRRPRARDQHRRQDDRRGAGQGERRGDRGAAAEARGRRRRRDPDDLHERPRPGRVHLADAAHRRHAGPDRGHASRSTG